MDEHVNEQLVATLEYCGGSPLAVWFPLFQRPWEAQTTCYLELFEILDDFK